VAPDRLALQIEEVGKFPDLETFSGGYQHGVTMALQFLNNRSKERHMR
jgi:hypothetical protein